MKSPAFLLALIVFTGCDAIKIPLTTTKTDKASINYETAVFVMAGQSNMTGLSDYVGPMEVGNVQYFNNPGTGPIASIASSIRYPGQKIIVNCAVSASFMQSWMPNNPLFNACVEKIDKAIKQSGGKVRGFFWMQGEAETIGDYRTVQDYAQAFTGMSRSLRSAYGEFTIILGQLGTHLPGMVNVASWPHIQEEQASISMTNYAMIKTDDLELIDGLHHTLSAYATMGERMATAWNGVFYE